MLGKIKLAASRIGRAVRNASLSTQGLKYPRRQRIANRNSRRIKLWWFCDPAQMLFNFGDEYSRDLITSLFGYEVDWAPIEECEMVAVGSVIEIATKRNAKNHIDVWGSGFISKDENFTKKTGLDGLSFYSVRGELTKKRLKNLDVPTGDPGLLANVVYCAPFLRGHKKIGVVIHYIDLGLPIVEKIRADKRFTIISPLEPPREVAKKIASCKLVLSSSLHGLIFADSFSVPNMHIKLSDNLTGGVYKFRDYYSGTGRKYKCADINKIFSESYLQEIQHSYQPVKNLKAIQKNLIASFPY